MDNQPTIKGIKNYFVEFSDRKVFVNEIGEGFPVLMLHGGGPGATGLSNYSKNIEYLSKKFRVLVPDMQGYGQSSKGINRRDPFGELAEVMFGLINALNIKKLHVVGNSYGGACALRMALEAPERIQSLVLMGPGGVNTTKNIPTKGLKHLLNYYKGEGPTREKLRTFIREYLVYDGSQIPEDLIELRYQSSIDPEVIANPPLQGPKGIPNFKNWDFTRDPRLARCNTPTLVLWGAEDKVNRPSGGETLRKIMKNCDLYLFAQTGHWVQWERAEHFNAVTSSFLSQHTPIGGGV